MSVAEVEGGHENSDAALQTVRYDERGGTVLVALLSTEGDFYSLENECHQIQEVCSLMR